MSELVSVNSKKEISEDEKGETRPEEAPSNYSPFLLPAEYYVSYVKARRGSRLRNKVVRFFLFVALVTTLAGIYYGKVASDRYVSMFQFTIESAKQTTPSLLDGILGQNTNVGNKDTGLLYEFIKSPAALKEIDQLLDLRGHYSAPEIDFISRLDPDASEEEFLDYYRSRITIDTTTTPGVFTIEIQAFHREYAKAIAEVMITLSEQLVNDVNKKSLADSVSFALDDVKVAEQRLAKAQTGLEGFQDTEEDLNPVETSEAIFELVARLNSQLQSELLQLTQLKTYYQPNSVQVRAQERKIEALRSQISKEQQSLVGKVDDVNSRKFSGKLSDYGRLLVELEFSKKAYETSLASYEMAKSEAIRKFSYVVAFVPPTKPDESTEPKRMLMIFSFFLGSVLFYCLLSFFVGTIQDHLDG